MFLKSLEALLLCILAGKTTTRVRTKRVTCCTTITQRPRIRIAAPDLVQKQSSFPDQHMLSSRLAEFLMPLAPHSDCRRRGALGLGHQLDHVVERGDRV